MSPSTELQISRVNGLPIQGPEEILEKDDWRQRLFTELLRQQAQREGLLAQDDLCKEDGIISQAAADAIEALIAKHVVPTDPDDATCRRFHALQPARFAQGEQLDLRHILFAVTEGVDVNALRQRAEHLLIEVRAQSPDGPDAFADAARQWSNCPSGQEGGRLGWLQASDCAPEFAKSVFGHQQIGVMAQLVHSRFGFHVVHIVQRKEGRSPPYEEVQQAVAQTLRQQSFASTLRQYLMQLAESASLEGVDLTDLAPAIASAE
jgi:peptidyl-prolyl cis-trans isomerase C